jgi:hypothetical protein
MTMTSKTILSGADFSPSSDVKYSKPKVDARGSKSIGIVNTASNGATYISTPLMITWGVSDYEGNERYEMSLQFPNEDYAKDDTTNFLNNMIELETRIKADAITNAKEWFGKAKMSEDAIDALWTPMLKYPKDKNTGEYDTSRAPTLKVKLPFWDGEWKTELYDVNQQAVFPDPNGGSVSPKDLISKGSHIAAVIQCGGLWFANGKFGVTWRLFQGVLKPKATMKGVCQIQLSGEDKDRMSKQTLSNDDEDEESDGPATNDVEDTDDDEAEAEAIKEEVAQVVKEAEPVVKKKVVKKVIKKKE